MPNEQTALSVQPSNEHDAVVAILAQFQDTEKVEVGPWEPLMIEKFLQELDKLGTKLD